MVRIAKKTDLAKIKELKEKINDEKYLDIAIQQIALILSKEMLNIEEDEHI
jgi:hypothetical protein